jgi:hypothetical protein
MFEKEEERKSLPKCLSVVRQPSIPLVLFDFVDETFLLDTNVQMSVQAID